MHFKNPEKISASIIMLRRPLRPFAANIEWPTPLLDAANGQRSVNGQLPDILRLLLDHLKPVAVQCCSAACRERL